MPAGSGLVTVELNKRPPLKLVGGAEVYNDKNNEGKRAEVLAIIQKSSDRGQNVAIENGKISSNANLMRENFSKYGT